MCQITLSILCSVLPGLFYCIAIYDVGFRLSDKVISDVHFEILCVGEVCNLTRVFTLYTVWRTLINRRVYVYNIMAASSWCLCLVQLYDFGSKVEAQPCRGELYNLDWRASESAVPQSLVSLPYFQGLRTTLRCTCASTKPPWLIWLHIVISFCLCGHTWVVLYSSIPACTRGSQYSSHFRIFLFWTSMSKNSRF